VKGWNKIFPLKSDESAFKPHLEETKKVTSCWPSGNYPTVGANINAPNFIKQTLLYTKNKDEPQQIDLSRQKKINKETSELNNTTDQRDFTEYSSLELQNTHQ
jgi:hypothetical protein